jgi:hypothetical protein
MKFPSIRLFNIFSILVIILGISESYSYRWLCDDAFISFSYARNFADGFGLVFQAGEHVEGYSNFLWTVILAAFYALKIPQLLAAQYLGILFYFLLLVYFYLTERKLHPFSNLPLFVIHIALFYHGWIFATSGLETMMFVFLVTVGLIEWQKKSRYTGILFLLAALTRPEGVLFLCLHFISRWRDYKRITLYLPVIGYVVFLSFRFFYYGDLLPNTFYAKANRPAYYSQGILYFFYWIRVYPLYLPLVIFALTTLIYKSYQAKESRFLCLSIIIYIGYVTYVGGDFMAMRFWMPIIPFLSWVTFFELAEKSDKLQIVSSLHSKWNQIFQKNLILIQFYFILSLAVYLDPFQGKDTEAPLWNNIGEERRFYKNSLSTGLGYDENALREFRVAFFGAQAHFIYFMKPRYAFEAESGLTDSRLARQTVEKARGRVGHERYSEPKSLSERGIELVLANRFPEMNLPYISYQFRDFDWHIFVLKYNSQKMRNLCSREGWNCSFLYKEMENRKLDINKDHTFWHD